MLQCTLRVSVLVWNFTLLHIKTITTNLFWRQHSPFHKINCGSWGKFIFIVSTWQDFKTFHQKPNNFKTTGLVTLFLGRSMSQEQVRLKTRLKLTSNLTVTQAWAFGEWLCEKPTSSELYLQRLEDVKDQLL